MRIIPGRIALLCAAILMLMALLAGCKAKPEPAPQIEPTQEAAAQPAGKEESPAADKADKGGKSDGPVVGGTKGEGPAAGGTKGDGSAQGGTKGEGPAKQTPAPEPTATPTPVPTATPCSHKWQVTETVKADCTNDGYETSKCEKCGKTDKKTLESNGEHDIYLFAESEGTCKAPAERSYACHVCGSIVKTETGSYGDHSWWVEAQAPTCTEDGGTYAYCQVCGEDKLTTQPATGHNYVDGECTNCGDVAKG